MFMFVLHIDLFGASAAVSAVQQSDSSEKDNHQEPMDIVSSGKTSSVPSTSAVLPTSVDGIFKLIHFLTI